MRYTRLLRAGLKIKDAHVFKEEAERIKTATTGRILVQSDKGDPTGITGLLTHPSPRPTLLKLYDATLAELQNFPASSVYRQSVENLTKQRKSIVEASSTNEQIEQKIGGGLIEEILVQAGEELELMKEMKEQKPWEELVEKPEPDQFKSFGEE